MDLDLLLRAIPLPVRAWNAAKDDLVWGPALGRLHLEAADVPTAASWLERVVAEDRPRVAAALEAVASSQDARWVGEYRVRRGDGTIGTVVDHVTCGAPGGLLVGVLDDVTDRRAAEQSAGDRATFAAILSHELRTPMNAVVALTSVLAETALDHEQRELVETVQSSGQHLLHLVEEVLDLSRLDAGRLELERTPFGVRAVIEEALDIVSAAAADRRLDIGYAVAPGTALGLCGDAGRFRQVLLNLLGNATKFTARGEVRVEVRSTERDDDTVELHVTVRDTGPGIAPERLPALFRPFTQESASTSRRFGGAGLGLAISKRLVELMGGSIAISSTPGVGTTVHFSIVAPPIPWTDPTSGAAPLSELAGRRVDVDVSSPFDRAVITDLLRRWGAVVDGDADAPIDVVIRDEGGATRPGVAEVVLRRGRRRGSLPPGAHAAQLPLRPADLLRAVLAAVGAPAPPVSRRPSAPAVAPTVPLDVLVAEDDRINQVVAATLLRRAGHRSTLVDDGVRALEALENRRFDVVLVDLDMPNMGGLELARRIVATVRPPPTVIALTADVTVETRRACSAAGVSDFLAKPITPERLAAALARVPARSDPVANGYAQLEHDLGAEGAAEIRRMFIEDAPAALERIRAALADDDLRGAARAAHTLRASCALFLGEAGLATDLDQAERAARTGNAPAARVAVERAAPALELLLAALRAPVHSSSRCP